MRTKSRASKAEAHQMQKSQRPASLQNFHPNASTADSKELAQKSIFNRELIKQRLPNLIRKEGEPRIIVNQSIQRCHSPFSKGKLKTLLETTHKNYIQTVVVKRDRKNIEKSIIDDFPNQSRLASKVDEQVTICKKMSLIESSKQNKQNQDISKSPKVDNTVKKNNNKQKFEKVVVGSKRLSSFIEQSVRSFY